MLLYKFRSFNNFEFIADILLNQRLYCAYFSDLNDPIEGYYINVIPYTCKGDHRYGSPGYIPDTSPTKVLRNVKDYQNVRVCSLADNYSDIRMWAYYASNYEGIAIEIDFSGIETKVEKVNYLSGKQEVVTHYMDQGVINPKDILKNKHVYWEHEHEYRIITDQQYFSIPDRIKRIIVGHKVSDNRIQLLEKLAPDIKIKKTQFNPDQLTIEIV